MAHKIAPEKCNACGECQVECPNDAISAKGQVYWIDPSKCKDCVGAFDTPQCVDICLKDAIAPA